VQASGFEEVHDQLDLLDEGKHQRWQQATAAADRLRDKYGDSAVSLAAGLKGVFRERVHDAQTHDAPKPPPPRRS
jgi:DNA polymerase-4